MFHEEYQSVLDYKPYSPQNGNSVYCGCDKCLVVVRLNKNQA